MKTEKDLMAQLTKARKEYHEASQKEPAPQLAKRHERIKALMQELSDTLADGAKPCPKCKAPAHGRQRTMEHTTGDPPRKVPAVYAVTCPACGVEGVGGSPEAAVESWNELSRRGR